jgi:hypothetical protein
MGPHLQEHERLQFAGFLINSTWYVCEIRIKRLKYDFRPVNIAHFDFSPYKKEIWFTPLQNYENFKKSS